MAAIDELVGDRLVVARSDRIELSKNILRGFLAFDDLLDRYPGVAGAGDVPGLGVPVAHRRARLPPLPPRRWSDAVDRINARWGNGDWTPIVYDTRDDYPWSVAVLRRADVLLVNPIRDGLNLVAKEGAIVNDHDAVLCLSPEAGVWSELADAALEVHPYDVAGTADVLDRRAADAGRRAGRAGRPAARAGHRPPPARLARRPAGRRRPRLTPAGAVPAPAPTAQQWRG